MESLRFSDDIRTDHDICFYHRSDLDGKCSAAIVNMAYYEDEKKIGLCGVERTDDIDIIETARSFNNVIIVDYSFDVETMDKLIENHKLIWIDHHKTSLDKLEKIKKLPYAHYVNNHEAACVLSWRYFFGGPIPVGVLLLGKYDIWDHSDERVLPFQYGVRAFDPSPVRQGLWESIIFDYDLYIEDGNTILKYVEKEERKLCIESCFSMSFENVKFLCANVHNKNSTFFKRHPDADLYDAFMSFSLKYNGKWIVSMYSNSDDIDVSDIAIKYGGGGHRGAAGFICDDIEKIFLLLNLKNS